jgi:hypothetical protein
MPAAPPALSAYAAEVRRLTFGGRVRRPRNVALVPASILKVAEKAETTAQFDSLAATLFPNRNSAKYHTSEILRRSGFYHTALTTQKRAPRWNAISRRIVRHRVKVTTMVLLDVCWFARANFRLAGYAVRKHSNGEIKQLGPGFEITESFYRRERLDPDWYSQQWFLERAHSESRKPGTLSYEWPRDIVLDDHWVPLVILGLYSPVCFYAPVVVDIEQHWRLSTRKSPGRRMICGPSAK